MLNVSNLGFCGVSIAHTSPLPPSGTRAFGICTAKQKEKKSIIARDGTVGKKNSEFFFPTVAISNNCPYVKPCGSTASSKNSAG
ncbi:hypothetical protein [Tychonema sp. LEGE 07203]|uniref:hypothetical protein n=1 Tax=Tychonema sp. LEGE 07203 TaxID=1828671 RepID=UPI0019EC2C6B|nr:hypothetical protein [Tychonema sp. LEGE 07203]MBE9093905.1 hypothetical protein [Tychonema sp. LEGE 07203]